MGESSTMRDETPMNTTASSPTSAETGNKHEPKPEIISTEFREPNGEEPNEPVVEQSPLQPEVLQRLTRQVEYYFSVNNLGKDTYLSTLRSLNDGYVPLTILANFAKIQSIVPFYEGDSFVAVKAAVEEYSTLLEVVAIDTQTGKKVSNTEDEKDKPSNVLEAVGPVDGNPIPMDRLVMLPALSPANALQAQRPVTPPLETPIVTPVLQNTIILREVPSEVEESEIRALFEAASPEILDLHPDVADCWYITLDATSREEMIAVMFALRSKTFSNGDGVQARLKSAVSQSPTTITSVNPGGFGGHYGPPPSVPSFAYYSQANAEFYQNGIPGTTLRKTKKKKNAKNSGGANQSQNNLSNDNGSSSNNSKTKRADSGADTRRSGGNVVAGNKPKNGKQEVRLGGQPKKEQMPSPPTFGEDQFPSLPTENDTKIEVEKLPDQQPDLEKHNPAGSDSASTATTSSSTSTKTPQLVGGYAAALLKAATPKVPQVPPKEIGRSQPQMKNGSVTQKRVNEARAVPVTKSKEVPEVPPVLRVQPPSWGGGKSFADALKKQATSI